MRLRPRPRVTIEQTLSTTVTLLDSHIRPGGDAVPHNCVICCAVLRMMLDIAHPKWAQCPECKNVMHQKCFDRWILASPCDTFACPSCRYKFSRAAYESDPDLWSATDVQAALVDDANQSDDNDSYGSETGETDGETDDDSVESDETDSETDETDDTDCSDDDPDDVPVLPSKRTRNSHTQNTYPGTRASRSRNRF